MEGFDVGGYARHEFARAAVVVKAQSQVLEVVIDLDAEAEEDVLSRSVEEVAVDEAEDGVEDIDAEEEQGVVLEEVEVGCDFCVGEVAANIIPFCEVGGQYVVDDFAHEQGLRGIQADHDEGGADADAHAAQVRADVGDEAEEDVHRRFMR